MARELAALQAVAGIRWRKISNDVKTDCTAKNTNLCAFRTPMLCQLPPSGRLSIIGNRLSGVPPNAPSDAERPTGNVRFQAMTFARDSPHHVSLVSLYI